MFNLTDLHSILLAGIAILAVLNPFGNLPQFIAMTEEMGTAVRQALFRNILYTSFIIVLVFLLSGQAIMTYLFQIDIDDLRIAGGLILVIMALKSLLVHTETKDLSFYQNLNAKELLSHSVVPMAFPMLVGPGTLSTVIVISEERGILTTTLAVIACFVFMLVLFHYAAMIEKVLGKLVLHVLSRIAMVFIMAMGVKMMVVGIKNLF